MRTALSLCLGLLLSVGCAVGDPPLRDAGGSDAGPPPVDAGPLFPRDAGPNDAGADAGSDAGVDASVDAGALDAGLDGGPDAGPMGCAAIHPGDTIALDGVSDLVRYPADQQVSPGAPFVVGDTFGITWDRDYLYVTLVSDVFFDEDRPLHLYVEAAARVLPAASPGVGKEYDSLTAALPFSATHLVALRRVSALGGPEYNGIYLPGGGWTTLARSLTEGADYWVQGDDGALSARIAWADFGCPHAIRLSAHVVNAVLDNEWKNLLPAGAQPWGPIDGPGAAYEIDLRADPAIAGWVAQ